MSVLEDMLRRAWENLIGRPDGPMAFRFIFQPLTAAVLAVRAGLQDAREGRPPFLWTVLTDRDQRADLLRHGWKDVGRVFIFAVVLDAIYQLVTQKWIYPLELLLIATVLALVPYLLLRGPTTRIARRFVKKGRPKNPS